jgi:hypothetical protein
MSRTFDDFFPARLLNCRVGGGARTKVNFSPFRCPLSVLCMCVCLCIPSRITHSTWLCLYIIHRGTYLIQSLLTQLPHQHGHSDSSSYCTRLLPRSNRAQGSSDHHCVRCWISHKRRWLAVDEQRTAEGKVSREQLQSYGHRCCLCFSIRSPVTLVVARRHIVWTATCSSSLRPSEAHQGCPYRIVGLLHKTRPEEQSLAVESCSHQERECVGRNHVAPRVENGKGVLFAWV